MPKRKEPAATSSTTSSVEGVDKHLEKKKATSATTTTTTDTLTTTASTTPPPQTKLEKYIDMIQTAQTELKMFIEEECGNSEICEYDEPEPYKAQCEIGLLIKLQQIVERKDRYQLVVLAGCECIRDQYRPECDCYRDSVLKEWVKKLNLSMVWDSMSVDIVFEYVLEYPRWKSIDTYKSVPDLNKFERFLPKPVLGDVVFYDLNKGHLGDNADMCKFADNAEVKFLIVREDIDFSRLRNGKAPGGHNFRRFPFHLLTIKNRN